MTPIPASLADLTARLPSGGAVYIDRDWLRDRKRVTATSALVFDPGSGLRWAGGLRVEVYMPRLLGTGRTGNLSRTLR